MSNDEKYIAAKLEGAGLEMLPKILELLRSSGISESCYAYKLRVKNENKLLEKKTRKTVERPDYDLHQITDVVGLRLVTLFKADMVSLFDEIVSAIAHRNGVRPNPFMANSIEEIIIYNGTTMLDELPLQIKGRAEKLVPSIKTLVKNSPEGYSSIHLVCRLDRAVDCLNLLTPAYALPIEIQIRTVFEDAWGEIDHKYGYVNRSGKEVGTPINNPDYVLAHLRVLKRFADACMEYADCIRKEAADPNQTISPPSTVISVDADEELISRLRELGVSNHYMAGYENARQVKLAAVQKRSEEKKEADQLYLDAAEQFRELAEQYTGGECHPDLGEGDKLALYYARMNESFCLMSVGSKELITAALHIYKHLEALYPDFPLLKMRTGQAYGKLGQIDFAIAKIRESGELATKVKQSLELSEGVWPDSFPRVDYEHFRKSQPKLLGYYIWNMVQSLGDDKQEEKSALFFEAYNITKSCLDAVKNDTSEMLSVRNNLIYYALGYLTHTKDSNSSITDDLKNGLKMHLEYVEHTASDLTNLDIDTLDTIVRAFAFLGRVKEAKQLAETLIDKCLLDKDFVDSEMKVKLIRSAREIINTGHVGNIE